LGKLEVGWEKWCAGAAAISLKLAKIEEKLGWRAYELYKLIYRKSVVTNALSNGSIPAPLRLPFP